MTYRAWRPGLFDAVRQVVRYQAGENRATGYVFGDVEWPTPLADVGPQLLAELAALVGVLFRVVAVQGYLNETATTAWHADLNFDAQAILSIGAPRRLGLVTSGGVEEFVTLDDGDLLFMPSGFQNEWQHSVPAEPVPVGERLALVFRS